MSRRQWKDCPGLGPGLVEFLRDRVFSGNSLALNDESKLSDRVFSGNGLTLNDESKLCDSVFTGNGLTLNDESYGSNSPVKNFPFCHN